MADATAGSAIDGSSAADGVPMTDAGDTTQTVEATADVTADASPPVASDETPGSSADTASTTTDPVIDETAAAQTETIEPAPPAGAAAWADAPPADADAGVAAAEAAPSKKPTKFLADLTKAMQGTARSARSETLERFSVDAKAAVERVHAIAAEEATELRRLADEDIAGVREWSKAEIARIREVTEGRISGRKGELESELEAHAGTIEGRIERVNAAVAAFEAEIAGFYDRLFAEQDPSRFAAMAEQLPEAPSLALAELEASTPAPATIDAEIESDVADEAVADAAETTPESDSTSESESTIEAAIVADDATAVPAESAAVADVVTGDPADAVIEGQDPSTIDTTNATTDAEPDTTTEPDATDPRLAALASSADDFAAAEAEAAVAAAAENRPDGDENIPVIADDVLAARIAGLVPDEANGSNPLVTTKVMVSGLVSVASIAGFKRHLSRLHGVTTVGVSSGPDGEFVFAVHHLPTVDLSAGITSLPGFDTRITGQDDGTVTVTARDPETRD